MQTSIQNMNKKPSLQALALKSSNRQQLEVEQQDCNILSDVLKILDSLFQMRFVEKISRPMEKNIKEQYVQKFAVKMTNLHNKLERIKLEIGEKGQQQNGNTKGKSMLGSATHKPADWKKAIRTIENRYTQVLIDGSFKHYGKLYLINLFIHPLKTTNIQQWATQCIQKSGKESGCCC